MFKKYQHVERFGTDEVDGIEEGECYIFPKIDGTNGSVFLDNEGNLCAGSRRRQLTKEQDNQGFYNYILQKQNIIDFFKVYKDYKLWGEYLTPHTIRTYRDDVWYNFYVFDVTVDREDGSFEYLKYDDYQLLLEEFNIEYIPPIAIIEYPSYDQLIKCLDKNDFLIKNGHGTGEGIVIKNYDFVNKYGRTTWAKIVKSEFKEQHSKVMGSPVMEGKKMIEQKIVDEYLTETFIEKEFAKIKNQKGWKNEFIPELFERVFSELIIEEMWNIVKKHKNPKINFKTLNSITIQKIKEVKPDLF